jgi:hypothetical protein
MQCKVKVLDGWQCHLRVFEQEVPWRHHTAHSGGGEAGEVVVDGKEVV